MSCYRWRRTTQQRVAYLNQQSAISNQHSAFSISLVPRRLSFPRSANDATVEASLAQVARERFGVTVRREDAVGSAFVDGLQECRPVGVIGEHEPPVVPALPADASDAHQTRCE